MRWANSVRESTVEWMWLGDRAERVKGRSEPEQEEASRLFGEGRQWHAAARELSRDRTRAASLGLYRDAIVRFAASYALGNGRKTGSPLPTIAEAVDLAAEPVQRRGYVDALERVRTDARRTADQEPPTGRELRSLLRACELVTCAVGDAARFPTPRAVASVRVVRLGACAIGLAAVLSALVLWVLAPTNVARGKHIFASSVMLGTPDALVNGAIEWGTFAFHSSIGQAYVEIDLGRPYALTKARIYNRGDSYLDKSVPLDIQLSTDGKSFRSAGQCTDFFTQAMPCQVSLSGESARYVRVANPRQVALSEIEVFGR